jgi:hypothetical protein
MDPPAQLHFTWIFLCDIWIFQSIDAVSGWAGGSIGVVELGSSCNSHLREVHCIARGAVRAPGTALQLRV